MDTLKNFATFKLLSTSKFLLVSIIVSASIGLNASANSSDDAVADRIKKVGTVCIEGADCGSGTGAVMVAANESGGAESNYNKTCATCHKIGIAGAPKFGDKAQWESRIAKGMEVLYASSINGLPPAMPAKGMCFSCSDDELKAIVDYMVEAAQ
ncbi:MAG: c-type cytochrome [Pseudomonadales bacterium]